MILTEVIVDPYHAFVVVDVRVRGLLIRMPIGSSGGVAHRHEGKQTLCDWIERRRADLRCRRCTALDRNRLSTGIDRGGRELRLFRTEAEVTCTL